MIEAPNAKEMLKDIEEMDIAFVLSKISSNIKEIDQLLKEKGGLFNPQTCSCFTLLNESVKGLGAILAKITFPQELKDKINNGEIE